MRAVSVNMHLGWTGKGSADGVIERVVTPSLSLYSTALTGLLQTPLSSILTEKSHLHKRQNDKGQMYDAYLKMCYCLDENVTLHMFFHALTG